MGNRRIAQFVLLVAALWLFGYAASPAADPSTKSAAAHKPTGGSFQHSMKVKTFSDREILKNIKGSDPRESDFPLVIKIEVLPVPEEIKGPFPADAPWRKQK